MEYAVGILLGIAAYALATLMGFDRDRAFYPTLLIVIASYYVLFAVMAGGHEALQIEILIAAGFLAAAAASFRWNLWLVVAALLAHGLLDASHHLLIDNPGVPLWWPGFCLTFDIAAAALVRNTIAAAHGAGKAIAATQGATSSI